MFSAIEQRCLQDQGYVIMQQCYRPGEVAAIKQHCIDLFQRSESGVDVYFLDRCPDWLLHSCTRDPLPAMLAGLGIAAPEFLSVKTVIKDATCTFATPWHQDRPYWGGSDKYSLWLALDDCCPANGCLRVIPGSHCGGERQHQRPEDDTFVNRLPADVIDEASAIDVVLNAGDAVLFHDCLFHSSCPNTSGEDRWSMIATYRSGAVTDDSTVWKDSMGLLTDS